LHTFRFSIKRNVLFNKIFAKESCFSLCEDGTSSEEEEEEEKEEGDKKQEWSDLFIRLVWCDRITDYGEHRVHIFTRDETGLVHICLLSWSVHCNFTGDGKCNEMGWAVTPHPHQPGLILPS
jgi:hypothetical protein